MRVSSEKVPGFGPRLRAARTAAGLTQQEVADQLGATLRTYQRYEAGDTEPALYDLVGLSVILGVTSDSLLGLSDRPGPSGRAD